MKKIIIFFVMLASFILINRGALALSEADCAKYGGKCMGSPCSNAGLGEIGSCWGTTGGSYCCGDASAAQQQMWNSNSGSPASTTGGSQSSGFGNPIKPSTIEEVLRNIMGYLQLIAGTIAVIFIIIGGVMYMLSIGDKNMVERAKKTLIFAIAGLAIVVAAPLFYQEIKAIFEGGSPGSALQQVLTNVLRLLLSIVGFLAIISMIIGSIWMFSSAGDQEKYELGKKTATYSIIGLIIAVAALIIVNQVIALISGGSSSSTSNKTPYVDQQGKPIIGI